LETLRNALVRLFKLRSGMLGSGALCLAIVLCDTALIMPASAFEMQLSGPLVTNVNHTDIAIGIGGTERSLIFPISYGVTLDDCSICGYESDNENFRRQTSDFLRDLPPALRSEFTPKEIVVAIRHEISTLDTGESRPIDEWTGMLSAAEDNNIELPVKVGSSPIDEWPLALEPMKKRVYFQP